MLHRIIFTELKTYDDKKFGFHVPKMYHIINKSSCLEHSFVYCMKLKYIYIYKEIKR